ncbi:MAG: hypothetical protein JJE47_07260 [Acidimicrobiia bacterium]|nr:hypothetical protein [Acidimicrobiia bacterium]
MTRRRLPMVLTIVFALMATACSSGANPEPAITQPSATVASTSETTTTTTGTLETTTTVATTTTAIAELEGGDFVGTCEGVSHEAAETAAGTPLGALTEDEYEDAGTVHRCFWSGPQGDLVVIVSPARGDFTDEAASLTTGCEGGVVDGVGEEAAGYVCEYPAELGGGLIGMLIVRIGDLTVQGSLKNSDTFDPLVPFLADAVLPTILTPNG